MCTSDQVPSSVVSGTVVPGTPAEALAMVNAALDYLRGPGGDELEGAALGDVLASLGCLSSKFAAVRSGILRRFEAAGGHRSAGFGSVAAFLAARLRMTRRAANADVRQMRQLGEHETIEDALGDGDLSQSWAAEMADWTRLLPEDMRPSIDKLLVDTAAGGADLEDLAVVARAAYEQWRSQQPDPDDPNDDFDDRYLKLGTTIDNAGRVTGDLTPEATAALQAVLEALGKKRGPEDDRTEPQRFHDALQEACELLIRARMVPDRAGADTHVDVVMALSQLREMDGAPALEAAWLAALAGQPGYLAGKDAEAAACDALIVPVVTGHLDLSVVDQMIELALAATGQDLAEGMSEGKTSLLSPEAWRALRYTMARLAVDLLSGPGGLAAILRTGLLDAPFNSKPLILDIGYSDSIPGHIRRAVALRDRHCAWPGCRKPASACDVHHLRHKRDGGPTSVTECILLCQFHHDVCIHRQGWNLVLHPDGTTAAYGPGGQVIRSHGPPGNGTSATLAASLSAPFPDALPADTTSAVEMRPVLLTALRTLTPQQRAIVVLRYFDDRSENDVAELLGVSPGTVKSTASRAMAHLRQQPGIPGLLTVTDTDTRGKARYA